MKNKKGWIQKDGFIFSVIIDDEGNKLAINSVNFPKSFMIVKGGILALMVSNYLMHSFLPSDIPEEVEKEIKLAIGDKG